MSRAKRLLAAFVVALAALGTTASSAQAAKPNPAKPVLMRAASGTLELGEERQLFAIPGIGNLVARRSDGSPSASVRLVNTSNRTFTGMRLRSYDGFSAGFERVPLGPGEELFLGGQTSQTTMDQASIVPQLARRPGPTVALDATVTPDGNFHVVARIAAKQAPGFKPAFIRQATARTPVGTGSTQEAPLFDLPGIGSLRATANGFAFFGSTVLRNASGDDLEASWLEAPSDQFETTGHRYVFGDGADQTLATAGALEAQWGSVFPASRGASAPFAQLAVGKTASVTHASMLSTSRSTGAKRAIARSASLALSPGQKDKTLVSLPGVGKLVGGCGATDFGGGGIELKNTSGRGFLVTEIEGYSDNFAGFSQGNATNVGAGDSALFGSPAQSSSMHLVSVYPEDPARAAPHYRLLLNIDGCDVWATATGAQG